MSTFSFRLVEHRYLNRIEQEDGPGSLDNIVSDGSRRVMWTRHNEDEEFGKEVRKKGLYGLEESSGTGLVEYSYTLERRPTGSEGDWEFVCNVKPRRDDDYEDFGPFGDEEN